MKKKKMKQMKKVLGIIAVIAGVMLLASMPMATAKLYGDANGDNVIAGLYLSLHSSSKIGLP